MSEATTPCADMLYVGQIAARRHRRSQPTTSTARPAAETAGSPRCASPIAGTSARSWRAMEFGFLFDENRRLLVDRLPRHRGVVSTRVAYDLLASEAAARELRGDRQGRRAGVATGSASGAPSRRSGSGAALISWSGSMFEYLMPSLVMRGAGGSLIEQTNRSDRRAPDRLWRRPRRAVGHLGIRLQRARSGTHLPILQLRRARPGASSGAWARTPSSRRTRRRSRRWSIPWRRLPTSPRLAAIGGRGRYGFYEAIDYHAGRLPEGDPVRWCAPTWRTTRA